jgi:hypothetical protein
MFTACSECNDFDGVDILVVVDNSASMVEEQQILATGFFTLINQLVVPTENWDYEAATGVRVAIVSSDMGLQYGDDGEVPEFEKDVDTCPNSRLKGDNGAFETETPDSVVLDSNRIQCDPDGGQCPDDDWSCAEHYCEAPEGRSQAEVDCTEVPEDSKWAYSTPSGELAKTVACMAQLGNQGCGVEQQLKAGVAALSREDQASFVRDNNLLAVIVISDEEDCSIMNGDLFESDEWEDSQNTACNYPEENERSFLYDVGHFRKQLVEIKDGKEYAVLFAAIVGVPNGDDSPCEGKGDEIPDCLSDDRMQFEVKTFSEGKYEYEHFKPACERTVGDTVVTSARPGRRYVKLAQRFGCLGYVYSICNDDWSDAMREIAATIAECIAVVV